ncbi:MAG: hypothetical protein ABIW84_06830 [Ilumatobacteraceae bacterium]
MLEAIVARIDTSGALGATPAREAARAVHALTEGLATMELRGAITTADGAERIWRTALAALLRGFREAGENEHAKTP